MYTMVAHLLRTVALFGSYALLIPGLSLTLVHWEVNAFGAALADESKSIIGLLKHLREKGAFVAANLVILYAMAIPACKLVIHIVALACGSIAQRRTFRVLAWLARWSTVDAFMVLFMVAAISKLTIPAANVVVQVEPGCIWFIAYCLMSTGVSIEKSYSVEEGSLATYKFTETQFFWLRAILMSFLIFAFHVSLLLGVFLPFLEVSLDTKFLKVEPQTISLWEALTNSRRQPQTHSWWLSVALTIFSLVIPSLEAFRIWIRTVWPIASPAHVPLRCLQAFSMLDVACMAGLLATIVTRSGISELQMNVKGGWYILLVSSLLIYAMRYSAPKSVGQPYEAVLDDDVELHTPRKAYSEERTAGREVPELYGVESKAYK